MILNEFFNDRKTVFTQSAIAGKLGISLSTVNNALKPVKQNGAVDVFKNGFRLVDAQKLITYWATARNLEKDVIYETRVEAPVSEIEKTMPAGTLYSAYSAYKFLFNDVPADYGKVIVYADGQAVKNIIELFPPKKGPVNLIVLEKDERINSGNSGGVAPASQVYVDLWNLRDWQAKEFLKALEKRWGF